ncbi:MAG: outer membrane protein assembly factor BamA [Francisellaceae bacterium]
MRKRKLKKIGYLMLLALSPGLSLAATDDQSFTVSHIKLEGLSRVDQSTIYQDMSIHEGQSIDAADTNAAISALYQSGYFSDVKLYRDGDDLIVKFKERPAISDVTFDGNTKIKNEDLMKVLNQIGVDVGNILNPEILHQLKQSLLYQYALMGYYSTTVDIIETPQPRNRVALKIKIAEGKTAVIRGINILGNRTFSESDLIDEITFTTPSIWNLWGLFSSKDEYSPTNMSDSVKDLDDYYLNRGFLDFRLTSKQASMTPDKENAYVAFDISEGQRYRISDVKLEGQFVVPKSQLQALIHFQKGDLFSRQSVMDTARAMTEKLGDNGYAFAMVNPVPSIDKNNHTVSITFYVDPGKKVYINQINFLGNNVTNDYVYRRQMQYYETGVYNQAMIDQSKIKLQRLPYVQDVDVKKVPVPGTDDMIDMDYHIKERSANSVSGSIGYSQLYKFMVGGNFNMPNLLGTGNIFSIGAQVSQPYQSINASYTDPFFTQSGISQTVSAYVSRTDYDSTDIANYRLNQFGANLGYSIPTGAFDSFSVGFGLDNTQLLEPTDGDSSIVDWFLAQNNNKNTYITGTINMGWNYNSTNRAYFPTEGVTFGLNGTAAVPGSDLQWYKATTSASYYHPLIGSAVLAVKAGFGYGDGYGKTEELPFFQNFYGGGWGSVRGFTEGSMGPADTYTDSNKVTSQGNSVGGNMNIYGNVDVLFPVPGVKDSSSMRLGVFFDVGNVYLTYDPKNSNGSVLYPTPASPTSPTFSNLGYSVGVEFRWISPLGPLAFSLAKPLNVKTGQSTNIFQFTLGQNF